MLNGYEIQILVAFQDYIRLETRTSEGYKARSGHPKSHLVYLQDSRQLCNNIQITLWTLSN